MTDEATPGPSDPPPSGGPLGSIVGDPGRPAHQRELARSMLEFLAQQRSLHARRVALRPGVELSFAQLKLLFHMPLEGPLPLNRFAAYAGVTPATATQAVGGLERAGLLTRSRSDVDRRVVDVLLTERGREVLVDIRVRFAERWDECIAELDADEVSAAVRVLDRMREVFEIPPRSEP